MTKIKIFLYNRKRAFAVVRFEDDKECNKMVQELYEDLNNETNQIIKFGPVMFKKSDFHHIEIF